MNNKPQIKSKEVFFYGILGMPLAFLGFPLFIYLPNFYVEYIGLSLTSVGLILFFARFIDMLLDPYIGRFSDKCCKRKTLIFFASFLLIFALYFLINPISNNIYWLFIFSIITYISYSSILIPYLTLNSEISSKDNYTKLSFSREIFIIFGAVIALLIPYIFDVASNSKETLNLLFITLIILVPIVLILFYKNIHETRHLNTHEDKFFDIAYNFLKNNFNNRQILYAFLFNNLANALPVTLFLFYVKYVLNLEDKSGEFLLIYFFSSIFTFPLWMKLSNKIGLANTWISSIILSIIAFSFVPFLNQGDYLGFLLVCIFTGMCLGSDMAIPTSIQSSIASKNENIKGVLFGFWAMITKFALSLAVFIAFVSLDYNLNDIANDEFSDLKLILLYSILPIILKIISIIFILRYQLTNKSY